MYNTYLAYLNTQKAALSKPSAEVSRSSVPDFSSVGGMLDRDDVANHEQKYNESISSATQYSDVSPIRRDEKDI